MIQRKRYVDWLLERRNNKLVKVISGVRRSGKSTLFELYKDYLAEEYKQKIDNGNLTSEEIEAKVAEYRATYFIHINFERLQYIDLRDYLKLNDYILERTKNKDELYYVFLDEIQNVNKFEEVVNSLNLEKNLDIYITGSNAYFMSGELASLLTGRYTELKVLPLSFKEFYSERSLYSPEQAYEEYTKTAFPYLVAEGRPSQREDYIQGTYNDIVLKDIVTRYRITDQAMLERVLQFLASAIGSEVSINKITNSLKSQNLQASNNTIERYVDAFVNGLILYKAPRYHIKGRYLLQRLEKYYLVDMGFRHLMLPDAQESDAGHILENIIFLELKRRYVNVYVGKNDKTEVDFVALDSAGHLSYFQVAYETREEKVLTRELRSLREIEDDYPKYLLTLDTINREANYNGIQKMNALDWLLEEVN